MSNKEKTIKLRDKIQVWSTDKDPYHVTGESFNVHPEVAEKLVNNGLATKEAPKAKAK